MSAPKVASLFGLAGVLGVIVAVFLGTSERADLLLDVSFVCLALGGLIIIFHVLVSLWTDYAQSGEPHRPRV
jgi:hypothetical protein